MLELIDFRELSAYRKEYVGGWAFVRSHPFEIAGVLRQNLVLYYRYVFEGDAVPHWLVRAPEHRPRV
ncbi:MAG TPA: hypothetical protein VKM54_06180 [Myxococcota bacterium]|nr:hypothetical protein [Myxococcota bacterium]